jgi:vacuolar-type H+-ATPase subunit H
MHIKEIIRGLRSIGREANDVAEYVIAEADHRAPQVAEKHLNELKESIDKLLGEINGL